MSSHILDTVPDIIREAALRGGVINTEIDTNITATFGSVPSILKSAYAKGDIATIDKYTEQRLLDIDPIYKNMQQRADKAFSTVRNTSDNREFQISIAGDSSNPTGYMWCYCPDIAVSGSGTSDGASSPAVQPCAQIGIYSVNAQWLGISTKVWEDKWLSAGADTLSLILSGFIGRFISNRIQNMVIGAAAEAAGAAAGEALVAAGVITGAFWAGVASLATGLIVAVAIGAITWFLVHFIADFVTRDYWVGVNVFNWDGSNSYVVDDFYGDNGVFSGGASFTTTNIPVPSNEIILPNGIPVPSKDTIYQYAEFILENDRKLFEGLGVAFRVRSTSRATGFRLKYLCPRFGDNTLGITDGVATSAKDYYNDSASWAPSGSLKSRIVIPTSNVPVICTTTALSGRADRFYRYDIHIGIPPDSTFDNDVEGPVETPIRPEPELPKELKTGDRVSLPNGGYVEVL